MPQAFNVYHDGKWIDTVFYSDSAKVDNAEVKRSLVELRAGHQGPPSPQATRREVVIQSRAPVGRVAG